MFVGAEELELAKPEHHPKKQQPVHPGNGRFGSVDGFERREWQRRSEKQAEKAGFEERAVPGEDEPHGKIERQVGEITDEQCDERKGPAVDDGECRGHPGEAEPPQHGVAGVQPEQRRKIEVALRRVEVAAHARKPFGDGRNTS